ncbi:MAG: ABC transporter ATP-binding protein/permease [Clostridia bacterium]|nr:ABC transporter ATP-binding protein/permease [Clostridia bacterium]
MLELKNITKIYPAGSGDVHALRGVSLSFRRGEFVSVLGPSGCGKTTMLNIIGGLDRYTEGDLVINGVSTRNFHDRDWDAYRNHSVGFVFQSYNLIPHQSVLQNVELALTLAGVSKRERRARAKAALERVGLGDQLRKRPGEMSGGQMQRVAIARDIVNDPEIVLADEPTGALDTETSLQVMEILKEISRDRLVIMVTHNPELAEKYSTRIIRALDGVITADSDPVTPEERAAFSAPEPRTRRKKRPSMSFATSFGLSLKNLFTKKGRTALTAFAGSIGIIGIALIYAVSHGMTAYIDSVQEETLAAYPLTIEAQHVDAGSLLSSFIGSARSTSEHGRDAVYQKALIYDMMNSLSRLEMQENDLRSFKEYAEREKADSQSPLHEALSAIQYTYGAELTVYTENADGEIVRSDTQKLMTDMMRRYMGFDMGVMAQRGGFMGGSFMQSSAALWRELLPGEDGAPVSAVTEKQYELIYGRWPARYDEIVLFVDQNNELDDLTLYALGLKTGEDIDRLMQAMLDGREVEYGAESWSYEEICDMRFRVVLAADCYVYDESAGIYTDLRDTDTGLKYLYDNGLALRVTGIARPGEDAVNSSGNGSIGYTSELTEHIITAANESEPVRAQLAEPERDIFTGLPFRDAEQGSESEAKKAERFREHVSALDERGKAALYARVLSIPPAEEVERAAAEAAAGVGGDGMRSALAQAMSAQTGMSEDTVAAYFSSMSDEEIAGMFAQMAAERFRAQYAAETLRSLAGSTPEQLAEALDAALAQYTDAQCAVYYDEVLEFSDSTLERNLISLGRADLDSPATVNLYASTFAGKDAVKEAIDRYNETADELHRIRYTDYVGLIMSSVTTIINAITYVLIAFVAVSLVVSSIMIGVITLISVQERTKEIGILRAIGASKRNVSSMFNAETVIIGFAAGMLGVGITWLLCLPINALLHRLTGIGSLSAYLPPQAAAVLVLISVLLTLIAGVIPSRSAAKKDPVVALRTE